MTIRPFRPEDAPWVVAQHQTLYAADEGFDETFGPLVSHILEAFVARADHGQEAGWLSEVDGVPVGCIFCMKKSDDVGQLRLFLVSPLLRGAGLGQALLDTCIGFARATGYQTLVLWTHAEHEAACRLYARNGFTCDDARPVRAFGRDLTEQSWSLAL